MPSGSFENSKRKTPPSTIHPPTADGNSGRKHRAPCTEYLSRDSHMPPEDNRVCRGTSRWYNELDLLLIKISPTRAPLALTSCSQAALELTYTASDADYLYGSPTCELTRRGPRRQIWRMHFPPVRSLCCVLLKLYLHHAHSGR